MSKKVWWSIVMGVFLLPLFFTVSCTKKMVQNEPMETAQPQVAKAPDRSAEEAERARRLEQERREQERKMENERLRAEKAAQEAAMAAFLKENIQFAFDSDVLSDSAQEILKRKAEYLRENADVTVMVQGHCDERGTEAYNIALGDRRAASVKKFLVRLGIDGQRLETVSYGEERPLSDGHDEASWSMNRRAQFAVN